MLIYQKLFCFVYHDFLKTKNYLLGLKMNNLFDGKGSNRLHYRFNTDNDIF